MDPERVEKAVTLLLEAVGEDLSRPGLKDTPNAVKRMLPDILSGLGRDPRDVLKTYIAPNQDEMILVNDIPFYSLCEHHLLPFFGKTHVAYIPRDNRITGFGDIVRFVDILTKRLQIQERLTAEIADVFNEVLNPLGVMVVIEAEHLCVTMRGVKKPGTLTITSAMRGAFRRAKTRAEALSLMGGLRL
ncbi:GTP cyclohydrolase I FolE [candidate division WOR-3 bacterium]|nr:GTP cyclohydrolase I FolE [candidate division WOR-3 bacterium]